MQVLRFKKAFKHIRKMNEARPPLRRGIFLLPNLFTTASLFAGFYAIVAAMEGSFNLAAIAIFIAMITDSLDGRIARMTHTESAFGVEYDSLADAVAFGVAPALVVYHWSLMTLGKFGWLVAFVYTAATTLRLARFNTQVEEADKRYFKGLPCPSGAAIVAGLVWIGSSYEIDGFVVALFAALLTILVAAAMVSNIQYHSFKQLDLKGKVPFMAILLVVLVFVTISLNPPTVLFLIFFGYGLSGPIQALWQWSRLPKTEIDKL